MDKMLKSGVAAVLLASIASNAWAAGAAATVCARQQDMEALRAAVVQQRLMVAALSCNETGRYNSFVKTYQKELQASDRTLQGYFRRLGTAGGMAGYHAFKTQLANTSSIQSIGDITAFCAAARSAFDSSLTKEKIKLVSFVATQPIVVDDVYRPCSMPVPMPVAKPVAPAVVPVVPAIQAVAPATQAALPSASLPAVLPPLVPQQDMPLPRMKPAELVLTGHVLAN